MARFGALPVDEEAALVLQLQRSAERSRHRRCLLLPPAAPNAATAMACARLPIMAMVGWRVPIRMSGGNERACQARPPSLLARLIDRERICRACDQTRTAVAHCLGARPARRAIARPQPARMRHGRDVRGRGQNGERMPGACVAAACLVPLERMPPGSRGHVGPGMTGGAGVLYLGPPGIPARRMPAGEGRSGGQDRNGSTGIARHRHRPADGRRDHARRLCADPLRSTSVADRSSICCRCCSPAGISA